MGIIARFVLTVVLSFLLVACSSASQEDDIAQPEDNVVADLAVEDTGTDIVQQDVPVDPKDAVNDDTGYTDYESDVPLPPAPHPLFGITGGIRMTRRTQPDGEAGPSSIGIRFNDRPPIPHHLLMEEAGSCQYWFINPLPPVCDPPCEAYTQWCAEGNVCNPWPQRLSAGDVDIEGLSLPIAVTPDETGWYTVPGGLPADLFEQGATISATASGSPEYEAFEGQTSGVGEFAIAVDFPYLMEDGKDNVVTWTPTDDDSVVELAIQTGWHGNPPTDIIWCTAPESDGQVVIPQKLVEMFPPAGGIGLFQHISWIRKVSRTVVEGQHGPVEITTQNELTFGVSHNQ